MKRGAIIIIVLALIILVIYTLSPSYSRYSDQTDEYPILGVVRTNFAKLDPAYALIPLRVDDKAYTEDKRVITLCLIDEDTGRSYEINTIMYVALHELAHVITPEGAEEHEIEFKQNFANLLERARRQRIYNPKIPIPAVYCNVATR